MDMDKEKEGENAPEITSSCSPQEEEKPAKSDQPSTATNSLDGNANADTDAHSNANSNEAAADEKEEKDRKNADGDEKVEEEKKQVEKPDDADFGSNFHRISEEIDRFISNAKDDEDPDGNPPEISNSIEKFATMVEEEISKFDSSKEHGKWSHEDSATLLRAIDKVAILTDVLQRFASNPNYTRSINRMSSLLQRAMAFLEEEFRALLEDSSGVSVGTDSGTPVTRDPKKQPSLESNSTQEADKNASPENEFGGEEAGEEEDNNFPGYLPETMSTLNAIAKAMISAGYESECLQTFTIVRHNLFEESLNKAGLERMSVEDVHKMNWDHPLEGDIGTWTRVCKLCIKSYFLGEKNLCETIFADRRSISSHLFNNLARAVIFQLLNFAEAVAMTKKCPERLFKVLDIYETLHDLMESMDTIFQGESFLPELKCETSSARCRIGEAAVCIFSDLENSIKADNGRIPVPNGVVHPLTRYVLNYITLASEYKEALEQVFQDHQKPDQTDMESEKEGEARYNSCEEENPPSPFAEQLMVVVDLLESNLEVKSKLYKDLPLSYIFLLNNGQYIVQKIRGSAIHSLLGDTWRRKRSSDLRQYHKNYQRETWGKVLGCLKDEGLFQGKGHIVKPALKERFKSFTALMDEIHRTQSGWVVSDEQLQSELRVSIAAVVIPAYRSFLGRFEQYLTPGRQVEKYIKYGPDEVEAAIDELFDGTPATMVKRRQ